MGHMGSIVFLAKKAGKYLLSDASLFVPPVYE